MRRAFVFFILLGALILVSPSCTITLNGASIPPELKTINIEYFENNAPLVVSNLSQTFTESIKNRIRTQTSLSIVRGEADATISGNITGYSIAPVSIQATNNNVAPIAGASRLTITVNVKYVNIANKKYNFEQSFEKYSDFTGDISTKEQGLIQDITKQLTEDIFNKAFANW